MLCSCIYEFSKYIYFFLLFCSLTQKLAPLACWFYAEQCETNELRWYVQMSEPILGKVFPILLTMRIRYLGMYIYNFVLLVVSLRTKSVTKSIIRYLHLELLELYIPKVTF